MRVGRFTISTSDLSTLMEMQLMPDDQLVRLVPPARQPQILAALDTERARELAKKRFSGGSIRDALDAEGWKKVG